MYLPRARLWRGDFYFCVSQENFSRYDEQPKTKSLAHSRAAASKQQSAPIVLFFIYYVSQGCCPRTPTTFWVKGGQI